MLNLCRSVLLAFIALAGAAGPARAQVVFDSFGPGNTYNSSTVWAVSGATASGGYRGQAEFFVPGISGDLSSVQLATYHISGSAFSNFYIAQDNGSGIPGVMLEAYLNVQNVNGLLTLNSTVRPLLQAGQKYWLCDEPAASDSNNGWYYNNQGQANGFAFERSAWGWAAVAGPAPNSGVFRISVTTPVPEPPMTGLLVVGGGFLAVRLRRIVGGK